MRQRVWWKECSFLAICFQGEKLWFSGGKCRKVWRGNVGSLVVVVAPCRGLPHDGDCGDHCVCSPKPGKVLSCLSFPPCAFVRLNVFFFCCCWQRYVRIDLNTRQALVRGLEHLSECDYDEDLEGVAFTTATVLALDYQCRQRPRVEFQQPSLEQPWLEMEPRLFKQWTTFLPSDFICVSNQVRPSSSPHLNNVCPAPPS